MALILSGHGLRVAEGSFELPQDITVKFITREGISIRDNVAGRVESNPNILDNSMVVNSYSRRSRCPDYYLIDPRLAPQLNINNVPAPHQQFIPGNGQAFKLSWLLQHNARILALPKPLDVIWCACRATEPELSWQASLRR